MHVYLEDNLKDAKTDKQICQALTKSFNDVESEWHDMVKVAFVAGYPKTAYMGSTALVALVHDNKLFVANAGHSKAVLLRELSTNTFEAQHLSKTHHIKVPAEEAKAKKRVPSGVDHVKYGMLVGEINSTRSLGNLWLKHASFANHDFD